MQNAELKERIEELKRRSKKAGLRVTKQRIEIFKAVFESKAHPDAETLYNLIKNKVPNVALDTVYRTLASLESLNMVFRVDSLLPKARFDADYTPHSHFLCTKCNEIYDIFLTSATDVKNEVQKKGIGNVVDVNIQVRGICPKCENEKKEKNLWN